MVIDKKLDDSRIEDQAIEIFKNIRCITCQGQSIIDSQSNFANDMRIFIRNELLNGKTKYQIEEYLVKKFDQDILLTPPFNIYTYILWFFPLLMIMIAIFIQRKNFF